MARVVEYLGEDRLQTAVVTEQDKKKLLVTDERGRTTKLAPDKVLFSHNESSLEQLNQRLEQLCSEVDVPLLWETLVADDDLSPKEAAQLAQLFFDDSSALHASAVFRALLAEREHFKRKGKQFEPRSGEDLERLREQRESEQRAAEEQKQLARAISRRKLPPELCQRVERFLRHGGDKQLATALQQVFKNPEREAFAALVAVGHLPPETDLELLQANLQPAHPPEALAYAESLDPPESCGPIQSALFSIDDPDTREVDDALSVTREAERFRVDVDIADAASLVRPDDPVDREARRRASTVYLPTGTYYMLPERLGCDLLSLQARTPRAALRTSVWLEADGTIVRYSITPVMVTVQRRLSYDEADALLQGDDEPTSTALRQLLQLSQQLAARRRANGALSFQQREFKIQVSPGAETIEVTPIAATSPSRSLVAEMMILANRMAARFAREQGFPIIHRVQGPPSAPPPELSPGDPAAFAKLRGLLQPASLSLAPGAHSGLGVEAYTQSTSPLRRYADLVLQRQLHAAVAGEPTPYSADELLRVLATAESTEREGKRLEAAVTSRWALEYVTRLPSQRGLDAMVLSQVAGGYKVELDCCGAVGLLLDPRERQPGDRVAVNVKTVKPRQGALRMVPA